MSQQKISTMTPQEEQKVLRYSTFVALLFGVFGIVWGVSIQSGAILFDGLYSFVSVALSFITLMAAKQVVKPDDSRFHFGRSSMEPLAIVVKSAGIIVMCLYAVSEAVMSLARGGSEVAAESGMIYAAISTVACIISWRFIDKRARLGGSDLVRAECNQWFMDTWLSAAVLIGFTGSYFAGLTSYAYLTPYIDPVMLIIIGLLCLQVPFKDLKLSVSELMLRAPDEKFQEQVRDIIYLAMPHIDSENIIVRQAKIGRMLLLEIGVLMGDGQSRSSLEKGIEIREEIHDNVMALGLEPWLTIHSSTDKRWL